MNTDMLPSAMRLLPSAMRLLNFHYRAANALALSIVEAKARRILRKHPNLHEFVMAMGSYTFTDQNGESVDYNYLRPFDRFMAEWNERFGLTGEPMRFTATGKVEKDW